MLSQHRQNQEEVPIEDQAQAEPSGSQEPPLSSDGIVCTPEASRFSEWQDDDEQFLLKILEWQKYFIWFNIIGPLYGMYIV